MKTKPLSVVKLGGSLLELPGVWAKLRKWLDALHGPHILVVGGGAIVEAIREVASLHRLDGELAHNLALKGMELNALVANALLTRSERVYAFSDCRRAYRDGLTPIIDPLWFLAKLDNEAGPLPHSWDVTSDSVAARVASEFKATHLYLLKSCSAPQLQTWEEFAAEGIVDKWFPNEARGLSSTEIVLINFRELP
jgi:5-(aminomethyl)-3-furanmethanol phosphate kinase